MNRCDLQRFGARALLGLAASAYAAPAAAQAEDQAAARALFVEARRLMKEGDFAAACPKFEAAVKLYPGPGVLLNLGDCYEHAHRTASAWAEFAEAESVAARTDRPAEKAEAARRKALLEPALSRMTIKVTTDAPGLTIRRDGHVVDRAAWGAAIPVDPGEHTVTAEVPGAPSWSRTVKADAPGGVVVVEVPASVAAPAPVAAPVESTPSPAPPPAANSSEPIAEPAHANAWPASRIAGAIAAGAGIVAVGVGGVLALSAKANDNSAAQEGWPARHDDSVSAVHQGDVATGVMVGGAVVAAAGVVLYLVAPRAAAHAKLDGRGFVLGGTF
jgi:tetratricopeptide (TPR) repeat protein